MTIRRALTSLVAVGVLAAGCATNPPVPAVTTPRFPEFPKPAAPANLRVPASVLEWHEAAWQRLQAGDLGGARRDFGLALSRAPEFYPAEAGLGFVDVASREFAAAGRRFERAISADASYLPAWRGLATAQLEQGLEVEAIGSLERVVALDPAREPELRGRIELLRLRQVQALLQAGRRAHEAGRLDEAIATLERAMTLAPTSSAILRELAGAERDRGRLDEALGHARRAVELDGNDPDSHATLGDVLEARGALGEAAAAFARAAAIDDRDGWRARSAELASRARLAALPPEFDSLPSATQVTRAQVAALIGLRLEPLLASAPRRVTEVATDVRGHWAASWILPVTQVGIMEIFPNHTFQPNAVVRRGDLARFVYEMLAVASSDRPGDLARWTSTQPRFSDLPSTHLVYRAASATVAAGVMTAEGGRFQPTRPVTGSELLSAVARIERLVER